MADKPPFYSLGLCTPKTKARAPHRRAADHFLVIMQVFEHALQPRQRQRLSAFVGDTSRPPEFME
jgi:hypothetical protein